MQDRKCSPPSHSELGELNPMSLPYFEALTHNRMLKSKPVRYAKILDGRGLSFMYDAAHLIFFALKTGLRGGRLAI